MQLTQHSSFLSPVPFTGAQLHTAVICGIATLLLSLGNACRDVRSFSWYNAVDAFAGRSAMFTSDHQNNGL